MQRQRRLEKSVDNSRNDTLALILLCVYSRTYYVLAIFNPISYTPNRNLEQGPPPVAPRPPDGEGLRPGRGEAGRGVRLPARHRHGQQGDRGDLHRRSYHRMQGARKILLYCYTTTLLKKKMEVVETYNFLVNAVPGGHKFYFW